MNTTTSVLKQNRSPHKNFSRVRNMTGVAMLSAAAFLLAFLEFNLPFSPSFAKMDFSDLPALLAAFAYGPASGVLVELIKNGLQLISTSTAGIGEFANFVIGSAFVFPAGLIYLRRKTRGTAIIACVSGSVIMGIFAAVMNYFVLLPLFSGFMPLEQVIASFAAFFPFIQTKLDVVLWNALPMNILKGVLLSVLAMLLYKPLSPVLKGKN